MTNNQTTKKKRRQTKQEREREREKFGINLKRLDKKQTSNDDGDIFHMNE